MAITITTIRLLFASFKYCSSCNNTGEIETIDKKIEYKIATSPKQCQIQMERSIIPESNQKRNKTDQLL